ncbi:TonB-dependent receptor domain-containing protein [Rhodocista pekingensis]|uniref:TonB-dependent receptor domain-containing protein n=1 Tax=Rhodocista pekingensis TaxID=201185 RepID=A0ABW2KQU2_9PROT
MLSSALKSVLLAGTILATLPVAAAQPGPAPAAAAYSIPSQDLSAALLSLASQSGRNILFNPAAVADKRSAPVTRADSFEAALDALLVGTGLVAQVAPDGSGTVTPLPTGSAPSRPAPKAPPPAAMGPAAVGLNEPLEEIVVTAQKRESLLETVPTAIAVLDGAEAARRGITDFGGLVDEVPGVSINYAFGGPGYGLLSIRGVGGADDYKPNGNPSVALHVDGIYQTSNAYLGIPLFDLERIEILKGPQGTLYGRNTTAGVVNAITRGVTDETEGYVDVEYGSYDYASVEAAVGGRLSDRVGVRLAVLTEQGGGFMTGRGAGTLAGFQPVIGGVRQTQVPPITDPGPREGFGDKDIFAARGTIGLDLDDDTTLTLKLFGSRDRGDTRQYDRLPRRLDNTILNPGEDEDPYTFFSNQYFRQRINVAGLSGELEHRLADGLNLTILGGSQWSDRRVGGNGDGTPYPQYEFLFDEDLSQASIEARLADDVGGAIDWIAGVFYVSDDIDFNSTWTSFAVRSVYDSPYAQNRDSAAVFGQLDWNVTDSLRLGAGARYTRDTADYRGSNIDRNPWGISTFETTFATRSPFTWDRSFEDDNASGRLTAQYFVNDALNIFVSGGTGYRSGGFDGTSIFTVEETYPFKSETVRSLEAGLRWTGDRFRLSLDGFINRFRNLQATTRLSNDTNGRTNVGRAETQGVEASAFLRVLQTDRQTLDASASVALLDSEITEFTSNRIAEVRATVGDPLPGAPDVTAYASLTHSILFAGGWTLTSTLSVSHHGEESNRLNALPNNTTEAYTLVDARVELEALAGWSVYGYGRNITDEVYFPELNGASRLVGAPATYGVGFRYAF